MKVTIEQTGEDTVVIECDSTDTLALKHHLVDPGAWVKSLVDEKVANCRRRMATEGGEALINDPGTETIPATIEGVIAAYAALPSYKNREERIAAGEELAVG